MIPQIQIQQTFGQIALQYRPMDWNVHSQAAGVEIEYQPPEMTNQGQSGQLTIDQSDAFAQEGLMTPLEQSRDQAQKAQSTLAAGVEDTVQWGESFARSKPGDRVLGEWALRYVQRQPDVEPTLVPGPFSVHIHYQLGNQTIHGEPGKVVVNIAVNRPQVSFVPSQVQAYVQQAASLQITASPVGQLIDATL